VVRILVICTGNVCRSPMGEGILKNLLHRQGLGERADVRSAGTWASAGAAASPNGVAVAARHGIRIENHRSTPLSRSLIREADLILTMEPAHLEEVLALDPEAEAKTSVLTTFVDPEQGDPGGVEDPFGGDEAAYEDTFEQIDHLLRVALPKILSLIEGAEEEARRSDRRKE
jgi:protein-tyrosine-phosphatase